MWRAAYARRRAVGCGSRDITTSYYDQHVWSEAKRIEKLRYLHRNPGAPNKPGFGLLGWKPVKRGRVRSPEDWAWSSFRHYISGVEGVVEIESQWTARKREQMGVAVGIGSQNPRPVGAGAPSLSRFLRQGGDFDFHNPEEP
jgi:hypothetical protein